MLDTKKFINNIKRKLTKEFEFLDNLCLINSKKVIDAFHKYNLNESDFNISTGYGYNDFGRDKIEQIYSEIFKSEDALVRSQIISGTHAITIGLQALLRPNDTFVCITGSPYDTLHKIIGIIDNDSSLKSYGINYEEIDLINNDFNYEKIKDLFDKKDIKMVYIQRSRGYSLRESLSIEKIEKVIKFIKNINKGIIIFIDNCYCEMDEEKDPIEVGASLCAGSLIKNLGAGICTHGGYLVGDKDLIKLCAERLNVPGEGKEVGATNANRTILLGLYLSPTVIRNALKTSVLFSKAFEELGYKVYPKYNEKRSDIVTTIYLNDKERLLKFCSSLQSSGAVNSNVQVIEGEMSGYSDKIIMASPSFTQGSSIELSCDGKVKNPYTIFVQGGLSYEYSILSLIKIIENIEK